MKKLLQYINSLTPDERIAFGLDVGTTIGYLRKASSTRQPLGAEICVAIETATCGKVSRKDLRPTDWERIWPELAGSEGKKRSDECVCMHSR